MGFKAPDKETDYVMILGASSGFGEAIAMEMASAGMNIIGIHMDRGSGLTKVDQIKSRIREHGVEALFFNINAAADKKRQEVIEQLPSHSRTSIGLLYDAYDGLLPVKRDAERALIREAHRHAITKVLESCPGFGPIRVAEVVATVVTPARFRTRQQFWSYCGLGIVTRSSSDWCYRAPPMRA